MYYLAFKVKPYSLLEKLITYVTNRHTKSGAVHCEIVSQKYKDRFFGYTSEPFVGVRKSWVKYNVEDWEFYPIDIDRKRLDEVFTKTEGAKYDYLGCLGFVFGNQDNPKRYFCSEWCATVLKIDLPSKKSPQDLLEWCKQSGD